MNARRRAVKAWMLPAQSNRKRSERALKFGWYPSLWWRNLLLPFARITAERLLHEFPDWKPFLSAVPRASEQIPGDLRVRVPDPVPTRGYNLVIETWGSRGVNVGFVIADIDGIFWHKVVRDKNDVLFDILVLSLRDLFDEQWVVFVARDGEQIVTCGKLAIDELPQTVPEWRAYFGEWYKDAIKTVRLISWWGTYDGEIKI